MSRFAFLSSEAVPCPSIMASEVLNTCCVAFTDFGRTLRLMNQRISPMIAAATASRMIHMMIGFIVVN